VITLAYESTRKPSQILSKRKALRGHFLTPKKLLCRKKAR
jgi:hypothetical protein